MVKMAVVIMPGMARGSMILTSVPILLEAVDSRGLLKLAGYALEIRLQPSR